MRFLLEQVVWTIQTCIVLPYSLSKSCLARLSLFFCCMQVLSRGGGHRIAAVSFYSYCGGDQTPMAWSSSWVEVCSCCLQNSENRKYLLKFLANKPTRSSWLCAAGWFFPRLYNLGEFSVGWENHASLT